jgi:hypothetical protein
MILLFSSSHTPCTRIAGSLELSGCPKPMVIEKLQNKIKRQSEPDKKRRK